LSARAIVCAIAVLLSCRAPAPRTAAITQRALATSGDIVAAVALDDALYVFARDQVTIERAGAIAAHAPAPADSWAEAIVMPALDDAGRWVVARTGTGALWRVTSTGELESIHDRLGLPPHVRALAASDPAADTVTVAFLLDDGLAVLRDRAHVARYAIDPAARRPHTASDDRTPLAVSASRDRVAIRRGDRIELWDLVTQTRASYRVAGAFAAALTGTSPRGTLVVATPDALFVEADRALRRIAAPEPLRALTVAGSRVWLATAHGVRLLDDHALVAVPAAAADHIFGLASGDVLTATRRTLTRVALASGEQDARWTAIVQPIFERVCARCHLPEGSAGVDLSTAARWHAARPALLHRVVETRTMPPAGIRLDDADRRALAGWLSH